jgi:hypothetical protein
MSVSRQEEIISVLWIIASLIAFGNGYTGWGWVFAVKGGLDTLTAIRFAIKEIAIELREAREKRIAETLKFCTVHGMNYCGEISYGTFDGNYYVMDDGDCFTKNRLTDYYHVEFMNDDPRK